MADSAASGAIAATPVRCDVSSARALAAPRCPAQAPQATEVAPCRHRPRRPRPPRWRAGPGPGAA
ncbi:hypothetical protein AB4Z54_43305, partial [Streptomyces sp. MCAF7]